MKNISFLKKSTRSMTYSPATIAHYEVNVDVNTLFFEQKLASFHDDMPAEEKELLEDARTDLINIMTQHMPEWLNAKQLGILTELLAGKSQTYVGELYKMPQHSISKMLHGFPRSDGHRYPGILEKIRVGMLSRPDARAALDTLGILEFVINDQKSIEDERNEKK